MKRVASAVFLVLLLLLAASPSSARGHGGGTAVDFMMVGSTVVDFTAGFTVMASASAAQFLAPGSCGARRGPGRGTTRSRRTIGTAARVPVPTTQMSRPAWSRG